MTYIVMEMQTSNGTTTIAPPVSFADRNQAESRFHSILASAAVSAVEEHAVVMLTGDGRLVRPSEVYRHPVEPEPEPDPEPEPELEPESEG